MAKFVIKNSTVDIDYKALAQAIESDLAKKGWCELSIKETKRGLSANAQQHVWYQQISDETGESVEMVACRCKRDYGLPIVFQDDDVGSILSWQFEKCGFWKLTDEQQLKFMKTIQVTSLMSPAQHSKFRDNMREGMRENGIFLEYLNG